MALVHKHLIIRAEIGVPPIDPDYIKNTWMPRLVDTIGMKILEGPFSVYSEMAGNRGLTAVTIIETSHIAMHVWDEDEPAMMQLDIYTCGPLDPYDVVQAIAEFEPSLIEMKYLDREHGLIELPLPTEEEMREITR